MARPQLYVPDKLWEEYKQTRRAMTGGELEEDRNPSQLFQEAIRRWLKERKKSG